MALASVYFGLWTNLGMHHGLLNSCYSWQQQINSIPKQLLLGTVGNWCPTGQLPCPDDVGNPNMAHKASALSSWSGQLQCACRTTTCPGNVGNSNCIPHKLGEMWFLGLVILLIMEPFCGGIWYDHARKGFWIGSLTCNLLFNGLYLVILIGQEHHNRSIVEGSVGMELLSLAFWN